MRYYDDQADTYEGLGWWNERIENIIITRLVVDTMQKSPNTDPGFFSSLTDSISVELFLNCTRAFLISYICSSLNLLRVLNNAHGCCLVG